MDALKCYLCETPRTFEERVKYPNITPVLIDNEKEYVIINNKDIEMKENNQQQQQKTTLTFITWNVWFNEELKVIERMKAIGDIIAFHDADIVCLQEVTPLILDILTNGEWYESNGYSSTILPSHGSFNGLRYFNVILTKHEFIRDSIQFKSFSNSSMGRHLIIAPIKIKDRTIYAATSHFESPVGLNEGGKKDRYSAERKEQLKYSLMLLDDASNVMFGGDMNWCQQEDYQNDGDMNVFLGNHWSDCFDELYPDKDGFTYDAKTNGSLVGNLQNRVDRILYKKKSSLRLIECQMIGREVIPNLSFIKKHGNMQKRLPVLPSDHYGLMAKFEIV